MLQARLQGAKREGESAGYSACRMTDEGMAGEEVETGGSQAPPVLAEQAAEMHAAGVPEGGLTESATQHDDIPDDANDNRGTYFRGVLASPGFLILTGIVFFATLIGVGLQVSFPIGAAGAGGVLLLALLIAFLLASKRAADAFYGAYAEGRGLTRVPGRGMLPPITPLLQRGDNRYTQQMFNGTLPGGLVGSLAHYTYEEESRDSNGNTSTTYYHFTIAVSQLPQTAEYISEIAMQRRFGFRFLDGAEDVFRSRQRVEVESIVADKKFEIFIGKNDEMNKARQVFSPVFIAWLAEDAHEKVAFELSAGALVVNQKGHLKTAHELDAFCEGAAVVARRLAEEAAE